MVEDESGRFVGSVWFSHYLKIRGTDLAINACRLFLWSDWFCPEDVEPMLQSAQSALKLCAKCRDITVIWRPLKEKSCWQSSSWDTGTAQPTSLNSMPDTGKAGPSPGSDGIKAKQFEGLERCRSLIDHRSSYRYHMPVYFFPLIFLFIGGIWGITAAIVHYWSKKRKGRVLLIHWFSLSSFEDNLGKPWPDRWSGMIGPRGSASN